MVLWSRIVTWLVIVVSLFGLVGATTGDVLDEVTLGLDLQGGFEILYEVAPLEEDQQLNEQSLKDAVAAIVKRVDILGVREPEITIEGENRIRVKLAGVHNPEEAREIIGEPAKLTFRDMDGNVLLTGSALAENGAGVGFDQLNRPVVTLEFKNASEFYEITKKYVGQPIAIYLDETMLTNPVVNEPIPDGNAQIDGQRSVEEAKQLADLLNAGALPVDMTEISSFSVGAKLGQMALDNSIKAGIVGIALVFLFMIIFYRVPGVVAAITLVGYMYLVLRVLTWMDATLTLPGIAAFILGVGMAVDANIITYERIKEEMRSGKTLLSSFRAGSRRSLATILDANITTIIAAIVLFYFGNSSIQGFAVMLILSIVVSLITAVFGARLLLYLIVTSKSVTRPWFYGVKESEIGEL
ncbi:MAG: protein translocase subunit SecD [Bacillaceae bacterium]|nr:protein translocase subunit SecD [Bacillaceae bacterium]